MDWIAIRSNYFEWRKALWEETLRAIKEKPELYTHNPFYHNVRKREFFEGMKKHWERKKKVPSSWIFKGNFVGIWTAMFSPHNTYSFTLDPLIFILEFYFKPNYFAYDPQNEDHVALWEDWQPKGKNPWAKGSSQRGTLADRLKAKNLPHHRKFYEENRFGAVVGYSDYVSVVILLEESIADVKFKVLASMPTFPFSQKLFI